MRGTLIGALAVVAIAIVPARAQQIEIDRTLERIYGTPIMTSDVREARLLKLVPEASAGDEQIQRALENRLLIIHEMTRVQAADPGRDAVAARRQTWSTSWPPGTDIPAIMTKCGTTNQALDDWFRSDLQIASFLTQKFGQSGDPGREAKLNEWIADLRKRANLR
jgi:hypothetical protein